MRILVVHNRYRSASGSGENAVVDEETRLLADVGHEVAAVLASSDDLVGIDVRESLRLAVSPIIGGRPLGQFEEALKRFRADVVHLHNVFPLFSPRVISLARKHGAATVHTVHNYRHSCVAGSHFRDGRVCEDCVGHRVPLPAVRYGCYRGSRVQTIPMAASQGIFSSSFRGLDRVLVLTEFARRHLERIGFPRERIALHQQFVRDAGEPAPPGRDLLFVGRFSREKGLSLLLEAWELGQAGTHGRRLRIIGSGDIGGTLPAGVDLLGPRSSAEVMSEMRKSAAVVIPSAWFEGFPRVAAEAFSAGRPVIASDIGGLPEIVGDERGWLFPPGNPLALSDVISNITEPALLSKSSAARQYYLERHTQRHALNSLEQAYRAAMGERDGRPAAG